MVKKILVMIGMLAIMMPALSACGNNSASKEGVSDTMWGTFESSDGALLSIKESDDWEDAIMIRSECAWVEEKIYVDTDEQTFELLGTDADSYLYTYNNYVLTLEDVESGDSISYEKISDDYMKEDILDESSLDAASISGLYTCYSSNSKWMYIVDNGDKTVDVYYLLKETDSEPVEIKYVETDLPVENFAGNQEVVLKNPYIDSDLSVSFNNSKFLVSVSLDAGNFVKADDTATDVAEALTVVMEAIDEFSAACNGERYVELYQPILDEYTVRETKYALADINNNGIAELILFGPWDATSDEATIRVYQIQQSQESAMDRSSVRISKQSYDDSIEYYSTGEYVVVKTDDGYKQLSLAGAYISLEDLDGFTLDSSATKIEFSSLDDLSLLCSWSSEGEVDDSSYIEDDTDTEAEEDTDEGNTEDSSADEETTWECDERFIGTWQDSVSQRCTMDISQGADEYCIEISWSESSETGYRWVLFGSYDENIGGILYSGLCMYEDYSSGELETTTVWSEGEGEIYFVSDNYLCWDDYVEGAGEDCVFEKVE